MEISKVKYYVKRWDYEKFVFASNIMSGSNFSGYKLGFVKKHFFEMIKNEDNYFKIKFLIEDNIKFENKFVK